MDDRRLNILVSVVTRNRVQQLDKALALITQQTLPPDQVLVVDNASEAATPDLVHQWQARNPHIVYRNTGYNSGSAGGQKRALEYAVANDFDLIYTMDDDCEPEVDALETIVQTWRGLAEPERWALNSVVKDLASERLSFGLWVAEEKLPRKATVFYRTLEEIPPGLRSGKVYANWGCFFNGTLLPIKLIEQIGLPREELFIRGDEVEYFYRLARRFRVGTALESVVRHPLEEAGKASLPVWKTYLQTRNNTVIEKTYFPSCKTHPVYLYLKVLKYRGLARLGRNHKARHEVTALAIQDAMRDKLDRNAFELGK